MSLTQTAYTSRKIIKFGGFGVLAIILIWNVGVFLIKYYKNRNAKPTPAIMAYGILPKMVFLEQKTEPKTFTFELPGDVIPNYGDQSRVYVIYRSNVSILALEEDKKTAAGFGFTFEPVEIEGKPGIYVFTNNVLNETLTVNVLTGDFELKYPYLSDQLLLNSEELPTKDSAIKIAEDFLTRGGKLTDDIKMGEKKVTYWKIQDGTIKSVQFPQEANAVRVDMFRNKLNNLYLLSSNFNKASISFLISGSKTQSRKIIEFNFKDMVFNKESYSTYWIKSTQEAIENLKLGNYWTAIDVENKDVVIRKIYLAYFEPTVLTNYLQPIYVFQGDNGFVGYVPAIKSEYFK